MEEVEKDIINCNIFICKILITNDHQHKFDWLKYIKNCNCFINIVNLCNSNTFVALMMSCMIVAKSGVGLIYLRVNI
jgi:hypothetical protein